MNSLYLYWSGVLSIRMILFHTKGAYRMDWNLKITDIRVANIDGFTLRYFLRFYWKSNAGSAFFDRARWFDLLMGTDTVRKEILAGKSETEIRAGWKTELQKYKEMREKYLLY